MKIYSRNHLFSRLIQQIKSIPGLAVIFKDLILIMAIQCIVFSCAQPVDLKFDEGKQKIVLNSILDATKDTIWVELSWSQPITDSFYFQEIEDATVLLSQNNLLPDTFSYFGNGIYFLNHTPCEYEDYNVIAIVGSDTVLGSTKVPPVPSISIEDVGTSCGHFLASIHTNVDDNFTYWITSSKLEYNNDKLIDRRYAGFHANSHLLDDYIRIADLFCSLSYDYGNFLRILNTESELYDTVRFAIGGFIQNEKAEIVLFSADTHYDRFIKSSIIGENAEWVATQAPFYPGYVVYYSNVKGGLGLVGSINSKTLLFSKK